MPYKRRGNKRRTKSAWRKDYSYYAPRQRWERKKKRKVRYKGLRVKKPKKNRKTTRKFSWF